MAASTASMCLRRESLSVHVHISSHDCSRFKMSPFDGQAKGCCARDVRPCRGLCLILLPAYRLLRDERPRTDPVARHLLTFIRDVYDAAWRVCLLNGTGGFARGQDDLEIAVATVPFLDATRELPSFQVERVAFGNPAAQHFRHCTHGAEAGERGLGVPFQQDKDLRLAAGIFADGYLRRRLGACRL